MHEFDPRRPTLRLAPRLLVGVAGFTALALGWKLTAAEATAPTPPPLDRGRRSPRSGDDRLPGNDQKGRSPNGLAARPRALPPPKGPAVMITKGTLLRLVVSLTALASLASLGGGYFDGI